MGFYAQDTKVSPEKSRQEIEQIVTRYGASAFAYAHKGSESTVMFEINNRRLKFIVELPANEREFAYTPGGKSRTIDQARNAYEKAKRQKWRALALAIKAKLESVKSGITSFEEEFLAHIVMPDGRTVSQWVTPQIAKAYETGKMPQLTSGE
jgi:acyl-CoA reductase-like NAD-dependent aldehyde dehydrogenase